MNRLISNRPTAWLARSVAAAGIYFLAAKFGTLFTVQSFNAATKWPAAGIALAAVLLFGFRIWPAVAAGALGANLTTLFSLGTTTSGHVAGALVVSAGSTLEAMLGAFLILQLIGARNPFDRPRDTTAFLLTGAIVATTVAATIGAGTHCMIEGRWQDFEAIWLTWWLGDVLGVLVVTPLFLTWENRTREWSPKKVVEGAALLVVLAALGWATFMQSYSLRLAFVLVLLWALLRFEQFESSVVVALVATITVIATARGVPPPVDRFAPLLMLQGFLAVISAVTLIFSSLVTSEERLRVLFEDSPLPIWEEDFSGVKELFDGLRAQGVSDLESYLREHPEAVQRSAELVRVTDVNQAALAMNHAATKEELLSSLIRTFTPETFATFRQALVDLWNGKTRVVTEGSVQTLRGDKRDVIVYSTVSTGHEGTLSKVLVSVVDITERRRIEESLRESELRYKEIFDNSSDCLYLLEVTEDGRFRTLEVNPALEKSVGLSRVELIGKTQEEIVPESMARVVNEKYRRCVESGIPIEEEAVLDLPSGRRSYESTIIPVPDKSGVVRHIVGVSRDVTERRGHEETIVRLNRVYRIRSMANQFIVHAHDREQLLEETCRIAVEEGAMLMAWVGFVDEESRSILPEAWSGKEEGYLSEISILLDDVARDNGPTGIAVRERRRSFSNNIETDPAFFPWRKDALGRGYRSVAAFPLFEGGRVIGAITLYAGETEVFNESELGLLDELARTEERRQRLEAELIQAQKFESLGTLASGIAHDFNNILAIIVGHSSLLAQRTEEPVKLTESIESIEKAAQRGASLVRQLLTFARKTDTAFGLLHVNDVVLDVVRLLKETFPKTIGVP